MAKGDEPNATRLLEALGDQPLHIGEVSLKAPTQWLGHQVEKQLQRQLEEQKKRELVEQQRLAEKVLNATERQPVASDLPEAVHAEAVVPTVGAIRLQSFSFTTCLLRKEHNHWIWSTKDRWIDEERRTLQAMGFLEQLEQEEVREHAEAKAVALTMVKIPAGSFLMGSPEDEPQRSDDEGPQHEVTLGAFFMTQTPITQAQWRTVAAWQKLERDLKPNPSKFKGANRPVERVSWFDAQEFCRRLSQRTGKRYGLPSEAQWEYACRAGSTAPFYFGVTLTPELANYNGNFIYANGPNGRYREQTIEVASFPANGWGLHDMHGNVWEWCADHWDSHYYDAPDDGRPRIYPHAGMDARRLLRGGSWVDLPADCRSATRSSGARPGLRSSGLGFRVCCLPQV